MHATTVAVDLAKSGLQLAVTDEHWHVVKTLHLTRTQFEPGLSNREVPRASWSPAAQPISLYTSPLALKAIMHEHSQVLDLYRAGMGNLHIGDAP